MKNTSTNNPAPATRRTADARLNQVRQALERRFSAELGKTLPLALLRRALHEAEQAACETGFALLVFPLLAEEIVQRTAFFSSAGETHGELASAA